jgi:ankyrin repeat protein
LRLLTECRCSRLCSKYSVLSLTRLARFLLARLYIELLRDKRRKRDVLFTLNQLPKGVEALKDAYDKAIEQINKQLPGDCLLARRALSWITYAQRPLTTKELCHAVSIEQGDKSIDSDDIYDVESVISVCAGLVTVDEESNIIRLVHYTTQEYFEHTLWEWYPGAQEERAVACLTYLSFDTFRSGSCTGDEAFEQRLAENAFLDYSAHYWSEHVRPVQSTTSCLALAFLCDETLVDTTVQTASMSGYKLQGYSRNYPNRTSGPHLTARYGLLYLTERLLMGRYGYNNISVDSTDGYGRTPLSWAAENGHEAVVQMLLEKGADANAKTKSKVNNDDDDDDDDGTTALHLAAEGGHEAVVRLMLEKSADINAKNNSGQTALHLATSNGHEAVVRLLLEKRADIAAKEVSGMTALHSAAESGDEAVVQLLLEKGADLAAQENQGRMALHEAAACGHEAVVRLLLENGDVAAKDDNGGTALHWAAVKGHDAVVRLLVEKGAEVAVKDNYGWTALQLAVHFAAEFGAEDNEEGKREAMARWLAGKENDDEEAAIHKAAMTSAKPFFGYSGLSGVTLRTSFPVHSPLLINDLYSASYFGREAVVRLLLEKDVAVRDDNGETALHWAARGGHVAVVKLLLETGKVDADPKDSNGQTPLWCAAFMGYEAVVGLLFDTGKVDADSKDEYGRTPLWCAAWNGHEAVVRLLLDTGKVDADSKDEYGQTPLSRAAEKGHEAVVKLLLDIGQGGRGLEG